MSLAAFKIALKSTGAYINFLNSSGVFTFRDIFGGVVCIAVEFMAVGSVELMAGFVIFGVSDWELVGLLFSELFLK